MFDDQEHLEDTFTLNLRRETARETWKAAYRFARTYERTAILHDEIGRVMASVWIDGVNPGCGEIGTNRWTADHPGFRRSRAAYWLKDAGDARREAFAVLQSERRFYGADQARQFMRPYLEDARRYTEWAGEFR